MRTIPHVRHMCNARSRPLQQRAPRPSTFPTLLAPYHFLLHTCPGPVRKKGTDQQVSCIAIVNKVYQSLDPRAHLHDLGQYRPVEFVLPCGPAEVPGEDAVHVSILEAVVRPRLVVCPLVPVLLHELPLLLLAAGTHLHAVGGDDHCVYEHTTDYDPFMSDFRRHNK